MIHLNENEKVIQEIRRHSFALVLESAILALVVILPPILFPILIYFGAFEGTVQAFGLFILFWAATIGLLWLFFFNVWTNYYLDVWVITNQRIIDIEQKGMFYREISEFTIDKVQDVTVRVCSPLASWLDFGDIDIQTAGESSSHVYIKSAPQPKNIKDMIITLQSSFIESEHNKNKKTGI